MKPSTLRHRLAISLLGWVPILVLVGAEPRAGRRLVSQDSAPLDERRDALVLALEKHLDEKERSLAALEQELLVHRNRAAGPLFELLCLEAIPTAWRVAGATSLQLDEACLKAMERSFLGLPLERMRALFAKIDESDEREAMRIKAIQYLGKRGSAKDASLMLRLGAPLGSQSGIVPFSMQRSLEAALLQLCERDAWTIGELVGLFQNMHEGLQPGVVRVFGQLGNDDALQALGKLLNAKQGLDPYVLNAISRCARRVSQPVDPSLLVSVRKCLSASDSSTAAGAVMALGTLGDSESIAFLIQSLGKESEQTRTQAWHALKAITGLSYAREQEAWSRWYQRESEWWIKDVPILRSQLQAGSLKQTRLAIGRICASKLDRHRLSELLLLALRRSEPEVLKLTCVGLGRLGSRIAISPLINMLYHRDVEVLQLAHAALQEITQMIIPADPELWSAQTNTL